MNNIQNTADSFESKINAAMRDYNMIPDKNILVGFSGGPDSTALLQYLCRNYRGLKIYAAHVNHMIRGSEADRDQLFCENLCRELGVTLFIKKIDVPAAARESGQSLEEAARGIRYRFFDEIMKQHSDIGFLATAHNADDNFETVIFNMIRGASSRGMTGIPPVRDGFIIRPLIYCTKKEIVEWCRSNNFSFVTDSTNSDTDYTRNFIRCEIIPRLLKINPEAHDSIKRMCSLIRLDCGFIDSCADKFISENNVFSSCGRRALESISDHEPVISRVLIKMYANCSAGSSASLSNDHIKALISLIRSGGTNSSLNLPGRITFRITYFSAEFLNQKDYNELISSDGNYKYPLHDGLNSFPELGFEIFLTSDPQNEFFIKYQNIHRLSIHKTFKFDKINGSLFVRNRISGDSYTVRGMTRRVKKIFSDAHMLPEKRAVYPIICDNDGIVFIPFCGADDRVFANQSYTGPVLHIIYSEI